MIEPSVRSPTIVGDAVIALCHQPLEVQEMQALSYQGHLRPKVGRDLLRGH